MSEAELMPTRNINLTDRYDEFVTEQIVSGRYRNASEVLRAGLRLLEQQSHEDRQKIALLQKLAAEGFNQLDQGQGIELMEQRQTEAFVSRIGIASTARL